MKKNKAAIFLSILTLSGALLWSGCYTQLAYIPDESGNSTEPTIIVIIDSPTPCIDCGWFPPPVLPTPPPPTATPTLGSGTVSTPQPEHRESGYQRSGSVNQTQARETRPTVSESRTRETQSTVSNSGTRDTGSRRTGR